MSRPKNNCQTLTQPQNSQSGPPKIKNDPKIKQKQISELTETYKMNFDSTSLQPQPQIKLNLNLNLNSIWLWHKINPILLHIVKTYVWLKNVLLSTLLMKLMLLLL